MIMTGGPGTNDPGRWTCDHIPFASLIRRAWALQDFQLAGPSWMEQEHFAITAKLPPNTTRDSFKPMLQNLLTDRFQLKIRHDLKEIPGYELVIAKGGPKLAEAAPPAEGEPEIPPPPKVRPRVVLGDDGYPVIPPGLAVSMTMGFRARRQAIRETMNETAAVLAAQLGKPVVNATGLKGKYDFQLYWIYDGPGAPPMPGPGVDRSQLPPAADPSGPTIFRAIQEQLGLRLEPKRVAVDFLTVESALRSPLEN